VDVVASHSSLCILLYDAPERLRSVGFKLLELDRPIQGSKLDSLYLEAAGTKTEIGQRVADTTTRAYSTDRREKILG